MSLSRGWITGPTLLRLENVELLLINAIEISAPDSGSIVNKNDIKVTYSGCFKPKKWDMYCILETQKKTAFIYFIIHKFEVKLPISCQNVQKDGFPSSRWTQDNGQLIAGKHTTHTK